MLNIVLLTIAGVLASYWHSVVPFAAGGVVAVALWLARLHIQPLVAVSPERTAEARKREGFWFFVFVLLSALQ